MIPKYLQQEIDRLTNLKNGISANSGLWTNQPANLGAVQDAIDALQGKANAIAELQINLGELQEQAHNEIVIQDKVADQIENLAKGIHSNEPEKLDAYGIVRRKESTSMPVPATAMIASIKDDADGKGFVIAVQALPNATDFEIYRGVAASPDVQSLDPSAFTFLTSTKKLSYTDDDVIKGKRYFYMVRGFNRKGKGAWSAVVSKVQ